MKTLKEILNESSRVDELNRMSHNSKNCNYKYYPKTKYEIEAAIDIEMEIQGNKANLNCIDTSAMTDMSELFSDSNFNGDISEWDTSNVTDMAGMFYKSRFDGDISKWDVSNVTRTRYMFYNSKFDGDISEWDTSNVTDMYRMFDKSPLEGKEPKWYKE